MSVLDSRYKALCLWFFTACCGLHIASAAAEQVLYTHSFNVTISVLCEEGEVTCERVEYIGRSLKTGDSIRLQGRTEHALCACLLYTSPSPRDQRGSRMPSSA